MPLYVEVFINHRHLETFTIGRVEGGTEPDDINTYVILDHGDREPGKELLIDELPKFQHRYGDGFEMCVAKGLEAYKEAQNDQRDYDAPEYNTGGSRDL